MVSLYFGHVSLHSSALPIPINQTPKLTEILCFKCYVYHVHFPILFWCFSYPCVLRIMQAKWALTELLQLQVRVEGNFVWFVLLLTRRRPPHLSCSIDRSIHQTRHHDSWPSFAASDLLPCRRHPPQRHHHHQLSRWTWGVHGSTREVALFCFCLCYALLKLTCYFIVLFSSWTPKSGPN